MLLVDHKRIHEQRVVVTNHEGSRGLVM